MHIPLASNGIRPRDIQYAIDVLQSGNLTMGANVKKFESLMAQYLKVKHFVMMNSGSSANLAMFEALLRPTKKPPYLKPGDGVLVPVIAWPTTIWPIIQLGLKPVFVDVEPSTFALDLVEAQKAVDSNPDFVKAIFPIHPLGRGLDGDDLEKFSDTNGLVLINDVCESLGSWYKGRHTGVAGFGGSFSFYFSHHITTMEGGGVATNDSDYADDLRSIRSHGWSRDRSDARVWQEPYSKSDSKFLFVSTGFNVRPMEIQAAIGISQISDIDSFIEKRKSLAKKVGLSLINTGVRLVGSEVLDEAESSNSHSWMLLPIQVIGSAPERRKLSMILELEKLSVETRPVLTGNFVAQPAMQRIGEELPNPKEFVTANLISETTFLVSCHHELTNDQIDYLCESLKSVALKHKDQL